MRWTRYFQLSWVSGALALAIAVQAPCAFAQGKKKPAAAARPAKAPPKKDAPAAKDASAASKPEKDSAVDAQKSDKAPEAESTKADAKGAGEAEVKAPEATDKTKKKEGEVVKVEESAKDKGVKTYHFGAIEVEGRLKSPQIIYFLRRVRAEFEAGALGHRSFMPELSDSRGSPALR